jgi:hypothetical protein
MCDREATSKEHVPPKCLFPEKKDLPKGCDFRKNLIKVPSCDEHNTQKCKDDEYLLFLLLSAYHGNTHKQHHFDTKLMRAVARKPHVYEYFLRELKEITVQKEDGSTEQAVGFRVDVPRFENIVRHMASGIVYHHHKYPWDGGFKMLANGIFDLTSNNASEVNKTITEVASQISRSFSREVAHGDNGAIFSYKLYSEEEKGHAIFMSFYEGFEVTVLLQRNV